MTKRLTKRDLATAMRASGRTVEEIAGSLKCTPEYVAAVLIPDGKQGDYSDMYGSVAAQNDYARRFSGVLRFRDVEAAQESVASINSLYHEYQSAGDRRGVHQAELMALIGKNRAEGVGKHDCAEVFRQWLITRLLDEEAG